MNKIYAFFFSLTFFLGQAQTSAVWNFENVSTPAAASTQPTNGSASSVSVGTGQTASFFTGYNSPKAISTTGFPSTAAPDLAKYFEFTVTPNSGFVVNVSEISFFVQRSNTGPTAWALRSSIDNYATNIASNSVAIPTAFAAPAHSSGALSGNASLQNVATAVTFRLYGLSASGTSGTMRVDDLTVTGTIVTSNNSPLISLSTTSLSLGNTTQGTPSSAQTFNVSGFNLTANIDLTAPTGFEISLSSASGFTTSLSLTQTSGSVAQTPIYVRLTGATIGSFSGHIAHSSTGATTKNVAVSGTVTGIMPTIIVSTTSLNAFGTIEGTASATQNYTVSGNTLTDNVGINAPAGFEISTSNNANFAASLTLTQTNGSVAATTIYVRLVGSTQGSYSGNITHTSSGASTQNVAVTGTVNPPFNGQNYVHLRGNFHAHTTYSDGNKDAATSGVSTPGESFAYAKLSNNFDFLGISEHNHQSAGMNLSDYALGVQQAAAQSSGTFSALYGMEYGVINNGGHMLVYGVNDLIGWETNNYTIYNAQYNYATLYDIINNRPGSWVSLAHPQSGDYTNLFGSQPFSTAADNAIAGCAIRSGSAFSTTTNYTDSPASLYEIEYKEMLAKGYHVCPFIDHDNHYTTFGRTLKGRTVVLAESNTPLSILAAVKARRVYASDDWNERINFTVNTLNIGSIGNIGGNPSISIQVTDPDSEVASRIELWYGVPGSTTNPTMLTSNTNSNSLTYVHNTTLNSSYYYYIKTVQPDGDILWTAPIWATKTSDVVAIELIDFQAELQAKDKTIALSWRAIQTGQANYNIERSIFGDTFETIGTVTGKTKGGTYSYAFIDSTPSEGYAYYRLKQIDEDGTFKYSNIVSIYFKPLLLKLKSVSPNPTPEAVTIVFDAVKSSNELAYFVYDVEGRAVLYQKIRVTEGENIVTIDAAKLPAGLYFLNIGKRDDRMIQTRFVKM